MSRRIWDIS
ncbi:MAG: arylformamidase KynB, partial [Porphyrobacter sp. HL-46]